VVLDLWFKDAIVYCLDVETFADSNGDGIGDFAGLTDRLDYLAGLGVTCLWLLPFYCSPNRDNGYDVSDYFGVDPRHGTLGDFVEFTHQAQQRGLRVIVDLVVNHSSDQHAWYRAARRGPESSYFDYYIWSKRKPRNARLGTVFPGVQEAVWSYDKLARAYYFHRFYDFQPDLNIGNPRVRAEIMKIVGFWLQLGVSGFRMDAVPFLLEKESWQGADPKEPFGFLQELRDFLSWRSRDAITLAEANLPYEAMADYLGDGDRIHLMFNFLLNQNLFLALASEQAGPVVDTLGAMPALPRMCQWANFLRNHDEIDLGRLSDEQRQQVFARFGPAAEMQLYDRGIRRRLAPMLGGDQRLVELAFSLLFSLPGTPVLWYGDEIGMGDDLSRPERESVRSPMQWSARANSGFSSAGSKQLVKPVISDGPYGFEHVNVEAQQREATSLLNRVERLIRTRKECREFGWGSVEALKVAEPSVLAHCCHWEGHGTVLAVHNLSSEARLVTLDLGRYGAERLSDLLGGQDPHPIEQGTCRLLLDGHGYHWFRMGEQPLTKEA
jgi:maltose alpha-D-glucosyltransferase/alpha-amylase